MISPEARLLDALAAHDKPLTLIPVGLPGAGKTTLAEALISGNYIDQGAILGTDAIRVELGGRRDWIDNEPMVFAEAARRLEARLYDHRTVFLDATNLNPGWRRQVCDISVACGVAAWQIWIDADPAVARARRRHTEVVYRDDVWDELVGFAHDYSTSIERGEALSGDSLMEEIRSRREGRSECN